MTNEANVCPRGERPDAGPSATEMPALRALALAGAALLLGAALAAIATPRPAPEALASSEAEAPRALPASRWRAGAAAVDVTPTRFPVRTSGGFTERHAQKAVDRLHSRALVLEEGGATVAIVVVDSCMISRELLDDVKRRAHAETGVAVERILISATHTHTAPAVMGVHGTDPETEYARRLAEGIVESIVRAHAALEPARVGHGTGRCEEFVFCRRWIMKPGTAWTEDFTGHETNVAQMNPGHDNPNKIRQTGPVDPAVNVLSVVRVDGSPLALLAVYSTHYAGSVEVSADYFGEFAKIVGAELRPSEDAKPFVALMANGTSGDANCIDFSLEKRRAFDRFEVARAVARAALDAREAIRHRDDVRLSMREELLELSVRRPSEVEARRAKAYLDANVGDRPVRSVVENYARETVLLASSPPTRELRLQALRIGDLGIAAIPCEVFGSTGLAIREASPFGTTLTISLANGADGYIPPPDQFPLGGYTTWRARSSCLEVEAEPKIRGVVDRLLGTLHGAKP